jgi:ABC-type phosphate transport system substrate-binding protein
MLRLTRFMLLSVMTVLVCKGVVSGELAVVVNKEGALSALSAADVKRIYLGRMQKSGATTIVPINLPLDSEQAKAFLAKFVDMTVDEYKEYWVAQQVKGAGTAPMIQKKAENVKALVSQLPGAIGYIDEEDLDESVQALKPK